MGTGADYGKTPCGMYSFIFLTLLFTLTFEYRQPTRLNRPSHIPPSQHYAMLYRPSKNSMRHGKNNATCQKQNRLKYHWMPRLKRLMTTIKKHRTQMRILWRCVRIFIVLHCNELMIWNWIQSSIRNVKWGISKRIGPENYKKRFSRWRKPL